jgi:hypothetical protein
MNGPGASTSRPKSKKASQLQTLLRTAGSSDEEEDDDIFPSSIPFDPLKPWFRDFHSFLDTRESQLPQGMDTIKWWG